MMKKLFSALLTVLTLVLILGGVTLTVTSVTGNEKVENVLNNTKDSAVHNLKKFLNNSKNLINGNEWGAEYDKSGNYVGYLPVISYGGTGDMYELNNARRREFIELDAYKTVPENAPILGAHSTFGGSAIIQWREGQHFVISNGPYAGEWVVVHALDVNKYGTVDQALNMRGAIGLQTCHWGIPVVRLAGAVRVEDYNNGDRGSLPEVKSNITGGALPV